MRTITSYSKLLIIAFSITCSFLLLWQYGPPILSHFSSLSDSSSETAPVHTILNTTPVTTIANSDTSNASTSIWSTIGDQLKLDHYPQNLRVQKQIHQILADKKSFEAILNRSAPFIYYIYTQTQERHLPAELALIPIIESEYNPNDHNSIGASGLWQLMPGTAHGLGVKIGNGYDGRRNVIPSTKAALTFFNDLQNEFKGNWDFAFAAYNCGPGCVDSASKKIKSDDYFKLKLPLETELYVPRLLAVAEIIKHAKEYGIVLPPITDAPYFTEVKVEKSESLSTYAESTGTDLAILKKLNPQYKYEKAMTASNTLLVPVNSRQV